jgi:hypothetical protein
MLGTKTTEQVKPFHRSILVFIDYEGFFGKRASIFVRGKSGCQSGQLKKWRNNSPPRGFPHVFPQEKFFQALAHKSKP